MAKGKTIPILSHFITILQNAATYNTKIYILSLIRFPDENVYSSFTTFIIKQSKQNLIKARFTAVKLCFKITICISLR